MELWIAGHELGELWVLVGVFDSKEKAVAACKTKDYFIGTITLNEVAPEVPTALPNWEYPLEKTVA